VKRAALTALVGLFASVVGAHPAPNSMLRLDFQAEGVLAEYWVPASELAWARAADPAGEFPAYLLRHVAAETGDGRPWRVAVEAVREARYLDHPYVVAQLKLAPPAGAPARDFVLVDDAITHEVRNHVVFVTARRGAGADLIGALQYPARRLRVAAP
jgi:hypothetical protein